MLFDYFSENALTPLKNKQENFSPEYVVDLNNGWLVAVNLSSRYCEAAMYMSYGNDGYINHVADGSFEDALTARGKPYVLSQDALDYLISLTEDVKVGEYHPYPAENYRLPQGNNLAVELDENWANVKSAKICYSSFCEHIEDDFPIRSSISTTYISYTIDDPEVITQLVYCLHPDNMKPDVATYRTSPNAYICFDNGYIARMYFLSHEPIVSNSCYINGTPSSMTKEAEEYISALMLNIEFAQ